MLQEITSLTSAYPYTTIFSLTILPLLLLVIYRRSLDPLSAIPGPLLPRLTPLWLYAHSYAGTESRAIHALHARHGPIVRVGPNDLSVADPAALATIYTAKGGFVKAQCYENFDIDGHASIFSALDPKHRAPRAKAVVGLFAQGVVRERAMETVEACAAEFVERIREVKGREGRVNVLEMARSLAVDAVTGYLFGQRYGALEERKKHGGDVELSAGAFVDTFVAVGRFFLLPNSVFLLLEQLSAKLFPNPTVDASMVTVDAYVAGVVRSASDSLDEADAPDTYQRRLLLAGFSESETKAQCKDLIFAGTDSTGMNLATACWHLAKDQDLLHTLSHELDTASTPTTYPLNPQTHPILHATLLETLRVAMANPTRLPRTVPPGGVTLCGHFVPGGTVVGSAPYSLHFDPVVFGPDPFAFRPGRWLDAVASDADSSESGDDGKGEGMNTKKETMQTAYFPFGLGPRQCIARNLASAELEVALRRVVESGVLVGAKGEGERIEIQEWFNSKVVGDGVWIC